MLIDFSLKNFKSFKDETVLSAETGERLSRFKETNTLKENNYSLLKNLLIFGPNGSGKSNLIDALMMMKNMVLDNRTSVTESFDYLPFQLDTSTKNQDIYFDIKFNYKLITFEYAFAFSEDAITYETLKTIKNRRETIHFERKNQIFNVKNSDLSDIASKTKPNTLFLYNAQQANDQPAIDVMQWFKNDLVFVNSRKIPSQLINLTKDVQIKNELLQFLKVADFNITDIKVRNVPDPLLSERAREILKKTAPDDYESLTTSQEIYTSHTLYNPIGDVVGEEEFPLSQESRGTQKIFLIALSIINAQINGNGKTLLFDEFDDSLHFELSNALIELFNSAENRNQFILTTHELQLLDAPLRVDQIYLIEKDFQGVSSVKSIFDFNDSRKNARRDISFMRNYMQGRFGAIPQVDTDKMRTSIGMKTN